MMHAQSQAALNVEVFFDRLKKKKEVRMIIINEIITHEFFFEFFKSLIFTLRE